MTTIALQDWTHSPAITVGQNELRRLTTADRYQQRAGPRRLPSLRARSGYDRGRCYAATRCHSAGKHRSVQVSND